MISSSDFEKVDISVGKIVKAEFFPEARRPAYKVWIDFGPDLGVEKSSAQITAYTPESPLDKHIACLVKFPPKQIGPLMPECLITRFHDAEGSVLDGIR